MSAGGDLDSFLLFGSLSGVIGQYGQTNYASENIFLDAFAQYRNGLKLAASVVDIGAVEDIGFLSEHYGLMKKMRITEQEHLDAVAVAMVAHSRPIEKVPTIASRGSAVDSRFVCANTFILGLGSTIPSSSPANRAVWKKNRRMAAYQNATSDGDTDAASSNETLKSCLVSVKAYPSLLKVGGGHEALGGRDRDEAFRSATQAPGGSEYVLAVGGSEFRLVGNPRVACLVEAGLLLRH